MTSRRVAVLLGHVTASSPLASLTATSVPTAAGSSGGETKKAKVAAPAAPVYAVPAPSSSLASGAGVTAVTIGMEGRVAVVTLNRPAALNALSDQLVGDICRALTYLARPELNCGAIVITGNGRAFAAGADIKEMTGSNYFKMSTQDKLEQWEGISKCRIPLIAAVNGFALGGGCEIAMMCDIIYASDNARFGQPEIKIGTIPGAGGTQRLTRAIGKSKAMELVLTGRQITAQEAERAGLVAAVVPLDKLMNHALTCAHEIASLSKPIVMLAKEAVNSAFESSLHEGVHMERRLFHSTFALDDRAEGMAAFAAKRAPAFTHH